jgi:UDP:flavonoid glycosyltransferase YjiC (YdhE family)
MDVVLRKGILAHLSAATADALRAAQEGTDVLVGSTLAFPLRIVREVTGIPLATVHLAPAALPSALRPPLLPATLLSPRAPALWNALQWRLVELLTDRLVGPTVNRVRAECGLPVPARRIFGQWLHSPDLVVGLFPDWFAPLQPDWPSVTRLTGFPLGDDAGAWPPTPALDAWLDAGPAPIVFTAGSANHQGPRFWNESLAAASLLGRRALCVTREPGLLPAALPSMAFHVDRVPFRRILPRAAALVSHGGIGTCADGLAAGLPQLVRPLGFDQVDNGSRLADLRVGALVPDGRYRAARVAAELRRLLESSTVARACASARARLEDARALPDSVELVERVAARRAGSGLAARRGLTAPPA